MTTQDAQLAPRELGARELAGYRVLRSLARDDGAEVLLGHRSVADSGDAQAEHAVHTVALKVSPASDAGWESALRECAALERARGEHVVELLDLDADGQSIRLLFERLPRGDLAELLRTRERLDAGEAVTLLAPIAITLLRVHVAGVAHGNVSARTVMFRDDGSPTLIGFSRAELFEPGAPEVVLEQVDAVRRDRAAARALATTVLGRVAGGRARAARDLHDDLVGCNDELILPLLASRLFEVAAAMPVRFSADDSEVDATVAGPRAVPVGAAVVESNAAVGGGRSSPIFAAIARVVPEPMLQRVLDTVERSPAAPVVAAGAQTLRRRWTSWSPGRRRVVLALGSAVVTVGVVTAVVPAGATPAAAPAASSTAASPTASASALGGQGESAPATVDDDPVVASGALLSARQRCLSSLSLRCLDTVDEGGSGALSDDQATIRAAQQGGELPDPREGADSGPPVLVERLGDSALVRLGDASSGASLLLVKGEGGWRIRDLVAPGGAVDRAEG